MRFFSKLRKATKIDLNLLSFIFISRVSINAPKNIPCKGNLLQQATKQTRNNQFVTEKPELNSGFLYFLFFLFVNISIQRLYHLLLLLFLEEALVCGSHICALSINRCFKTNVDNIEVDEIKQFV